MRTTTPKKTMSGLAALLGAMLSGCGGEEPAALGPEAPAAAPPVALAQDRYVLTESAFGFDQTLSRLFEALDRRELTVFAVIDHVAAARSVGADLPPTTVVVFGDPRGGTPLMAAVPVLGAELPLRALVFERDGAVFLAVTGIDNIARTYPLDEQEQITGAIAEMLGGVSAEVTTP